MSTQTCVFCRIVAGEIPSHKVMETDAAIAFLDIAPLADGHTLIIPKRHFERLDEMPADLAAELARCLPRLGAAVCRASGARAYNILQNNGTASGQVVMHVHFHLIPRRENDGLGYRWNAGAYAAGEAARLAAAVTAELARGTSGDGSAHVDKIHAE